MIVPIDTQGRKNPRADATATLVARAAIVRVVGPLVLRHGGRPRNSYSSTSSMPDYEKLGKRKLPFVSVGVLCCVVQLYVNLASFLRTTQDSNESNLRRASGARKEAKDTACHNSSIRHLCGK